ncbi:dynein assembly factor with WDR repeat domains 1 isoform X2 [Zootermopsis nevadensis]|uniref:dynein assembly factor with WDR repeat domains 1 isoform X2 n=1 Tax=Zootermopsis nevadensis TaxID=136037 RepID=UPI000B8ED806|nr:dynein assembly factor with WDR repeat domains 1 isoform X2 [Zootermopsis nevadensis]
MIFIERVFVLKTPTMRLKRFLLRYFPPGIALEYIQGGKTKTKMLGLSSLSTRTNVNELAATIAADEPLVTPSVVPQLVESLCKLQTKLSDASNHWFHNSKTLKTHLLPLTNVAFDKQGKRCLTGSYDRTCKVWDTDSGKELCTLKGHKNVVYAVTFNSPFDDKILTGSFDKTACLWSAETGECYSTLWGHTAEVVAVQFNLQCHLVGTSSMDSTAKLFNIATGQEVATLHGHTGEVIALKFSDDGNQIITGSFDHSIGVWDTRTAKRVGILNGHLQEISNCLFNHDGSLIASSSMDKTAKVWDQRTFSSLATITGHNDEVLDIAFDYKGHQLATASTDATACIWDVHSDFKLLAKMKGHKEEVSKSCGSSASDCIARQNSSSVECRHWELYPDTRWTYR